MMTTTDFQILINTLSSISVAGKDNMSCLLGAIEYLERKMQQYQGENEQHEG